MAKIKDIGRYKTKKSLKERIEKLEREMMTIKRAMKERQRVVYIDKTQNL